MAEDHSDSQRRDEFTAKWRRYLSKWRRNYWSITNFIKFFRFNTHALFSLPGQLMTDPGLVSFGDQSPQTWKIFIVAWIWAIAGFFSGSVIGLYAITEFNLADNPNVSWFMIGASIAGALIATSIISLSMMFSTFVVNIRILQRMGRGYGKPDTGDNFVDAFRDTMYGLTFSYYGGILIVLAVTVALLIHLPNNSSLVTVGLGGGVLTKLGGTLVFAVLIPVTKSLLSSAIVGAIWHFFRGESRRKSSSEEPVSSPAPKLSALNKRQRELVQLSHEAMELLVQSQIRPLDHPLHLSLPGHHIGGAIESQQLSLPGHHNAAATVPQHPLHIETEPHPNPSPPSPPSTSG